MRQRQVHATHLALLADSLAGAVQGVTCVTQELRVHAVGGAITVNVRLLDACEQSKRGQRRRLTHVRRQAAPITAPCSNRRCHSMQYRTIAVVLPRLVVGSVVFPLGHG